MPSIPWPSWSSEEKKPTAVPVNVPPVTADNGLDTLKAQLNALPPWVSYAAFITAGSVATLSSRRVYKRYGRRIRNSNWVTPQFLNGNRWIKGRVTSVGDADNFRLYHTPAIGYTWPLKFRRVPTTAKELKNETIHIRLAGVDAPEAGHFGKPAQPYAAESLQWLRDMILDKKVYCQLRRKDQYGRVVAHVYLAHRIFPGFMFNGKNLAAEMIKAGCGVTYEQAGAEYGELGKDGYLRLEEEAKRNRRGMWKKGALGETPAEYKKRHAQASSLEEAEKSKPAAAPVAERKGIFRRLFWS